MTTLRTSAPFRGARRMLVSPGSLAPSMSSIALVLALLLWPRAVQGDVIDDYGTVGGRAPFRSAASTGRRIMVVGDSIQSGTGLGPSRVRRRGGCSATAESSSTTSPAREQRWPTRSFPA